MTDAAVAIRATEPTLTPFEVIERVITQGDLSKMTPQDRIAFYWRTCESIGLNPLTRPFEFINLSGKLTMYAKKDATDQLRKIHRVSIDSLDQVILDDILTVTATGHTPDGRTDSDVGSVSVKGLSGEARANATKKAITQAKRRLTLSLVGLGFLDESEVEGATADVDPTTGEILERPKPKTLLESVKAEQEKLAPAAAPIGATETPDEAAPLSTSTPEPEAAAAAGDETTGDFREVPAGLTEAELKAALTERGIAEDYARIRGAEMFPRPPRTALTPEQRAALLADLTTDASL